MSKKPETLVILGGTSAVAMAYARQAAEGYDAVCLVGRNKKVLEDNKLDLAGRSTAVVSTHICDLADTANIEKHWKSIVSSHKNTVSVLIAYGVLGDQATSQENMESLKNGLMTNFVSAAMWSELAFTHFEKQGHGKICVIGSVAGDRGRQSNYHYGAAKGALEIFCDGMAHRAALLVGAKVNILLVKPGFIDTPMTDGLEKGGPLWASPEKIGRIISKGQKRGKTKIYAPWFWFWILLIIKYLPNFVFHKSKL